MKNILLLVHDDAGQEARLQAALDVTRALGGHLKCLDVIPLAVIPGDIYGSGGSVIMLDYERQQESANKQRLQQRLASEDVAWEWQDMTGDMEACISDCATLADLIVVNRQLDDYPVPDMRNIASSLVVKSGVAVLAVPQHATGFLAAGSALVAWDGSPEAAAALAAAVPLLKLATSVTIVAVEDGSIQTPAEEAAAYLSRHDIHPQVVEAHPEGNAAAAVILAKANSGKFDYLVMGGFGHGRLVEALFGGVTRRVLTESPIPVLMAH
jgi:nucleotide-binding universal stress UspA family protein